MDKLKEALLLTIDEGKRNKRYLDSKGIWTIGVGWNLQANKLPPDIASFERLNGYITDDMVNQLLEIQIEAKLKDCLYLWPNFNTFDEARQEALCDIMFNMGLGTLKGFHHMNEAINGDPPDWEKAANELKFSDGVSHLSKWYQDVHERRGEEIYGMILNG